MNILDALLAIIAAIVIVKVTVRGFVDEFFSMAAFFIALTAAFLFYRQVSLQITIQNIPPIAMKLIAFFVIFILIFIAVKIIQMLIATAFNNEILGSLNHALGFFLGIFEACIILIIIGSILRMQPFVKLDALIANSKLLNLLPFVNADSAAVLKVPDFLNISNSI